MRSARLLSFAAAAAVLASGCDSARPVEQRSSATACERCHGFPPPPMARAVDGAAHPQSVSCEVCHRSTVGEGGVFLAEGGKHMNGVTDFLAHPAPYPTHAVEVYGGLGGCTHCHGSDFEGGAAASCNGCHGDFGFGDWATNCTFCHGGRTSGWTAAELWKAAPGEADETANPENEDVPNYRGVGAHTAHVEAPAFSSPIACTECHPPVANLSHFDRTTEIAWGPIASAGGAEPTWTGTTCSNYCHGASLPKPETRTAPVWAPPSDVACGGCHEANPTTGVHPATSTGHREFGCNVCHGPGYSTTAVDRPLHVNGALDVTEITGFDPSARSCNALCHSGSRSWP